MSAHRGLLQQHISGFCVGGGGNPSLRPAASVRFFLAVQELIHLFRYQSQTCRVTDSLATTIRGAGKFGIVVRTVEGARITIATIFC